MTEDDVTISDKVKQFFIEKINQNFEVKDKDTFSQLRKMAMDSFHLSGGWRQKTKQILEDVLKEKNIQLAIEKKPEGIKATLVREEIQAQQPTQQPSPHGTLPKPESKQEPTQQSQQRIQLTESDKQAYEVMFKTGFSFLTDIYVKFELIQVKDHEIKEKLTLEEYKNDTDKLAAAWSDYCYRNNIHLPKYLELIILCVATGAIFGMPVINVLVFGKKSKAKEQDEKLEGVGEQ